MKVRLLDSRQARKELTRLLAKHEEIHWAVAWGSRKTEWRTLTEQKKKFRNVVFGIAFSQTDPDLLEDLVGVKGAFVVESFPGGTYHPKLYAFRTKDRAAAIVGSANFTSGGMGRNFEVSALFEGDAQDPFFEDIFRTVARAAAAGTEVDAKLVANYRLQVEIAKSRRGPRRDPLLARVRPDPVVTLDFVETGWGDYAALLASIDADSLAGRLAMLDAARDLFLRQPQFDRLERLERKAIAGIVGKKERASLSYTGDWGWFGSMTGFGDLRGLIGTGSRRLARAVDAIPLQGHVDEDHYESFVDLFEKAFDRTARTGGVATATRFLAVKRPDCFVCICKPNRQSASRHIGFAYSTLTLDNYWERVIEPMRASRWFRSPRPESGPEARLWDARAAMLDALYY